MDAAGTSLRLHPFRRRRKYLLRLAFTFRPQEDHHQIVMSSSTTFSLNGVHTYYDATHHNHLYASNYHELKDGNAQYKHEGVRFKVLDKPLPGMVPIYRYYQKDKVDHFYTADVKEIGTTTPGETGAHGYTYEGILGYGFSMPVVGTMPLYRYGAKDHCNHFYTTNAKEIGVTEAGQSAKGYISEGITAYVWPC